jgi:hypothetical protein
MIDTRNSSNLIHVGAEDLPINNKQVYGTCKGCHNHLGSPFYQYYHIETTGEDYRRGPISSLDDLTRYDFLVNKKLRDGFPGRYIKFDEFPPKKEMLCSSCDTGKESKIDFIQLHLLSDSINTGLHRYIAALPDLSDYPPPSNIDEGFFGLGDGAYHELQDSLDIAFAEENAKLEKYEEDRLNDLLNNFVEEMGRRYPNDKELAQWLGVPRCKIFDLRGMNYIRWFEVRRFVVIVHLEKVSGPWCEFLVPAYYR